MLDHVSRGRCVPIVSVGSGAREEVVSFLAIWRERSAGIGTVSDSRLRLSDLSENKGAILRRYNDMS